MHDVACGNTPYCHWQFSELTGCSVVIDKCVCGCRVICRAWVSFVASLQPALKPARPGPLLAALAMSTYGPWFAFRPDTRHDADSHRPRSGRVPCQRRPIRSDKPVRLARLLPDHIRNNNHNIPHAQTPSHSCP